MIEYYGPVIEHIQFNKNIVAYALSRLPININQENTHESTYQK